MIAQVISFLPPAHVGNLDGVPDPQLQPGLVTPHAGISGMNWYMGASLSLALSLASS